MQATHTGLMIVATAQRAKATQKKAKTAGCSSTRFADMSESELDALIDRIEQAKTHSLALSAADYVLLLGAIMMLANSQERLEGNDLSIHKLRKLLGMVRSSEKLRDLLPAADDEKVQDSDADSKTRRAWFRQGPAPREKKQAKE